jgi:hypothetical protein
MAAAIPRRKPLSQITLDTDPIEYKKSRAISVLLIFAALTMLL